MVQVLWSQSFATISMIGYQVDTSNERQRLMRWNVCYLALAACCALLLSGTEVLFASTIHEVSFSLRGVQESFASSPVNRRTPPPGSPLQLRVNSSTALPLPLPTPEPDNDRLLTYIPGDPPSYEYSIRAENSAEFGWDWQAIEAGLGSSLSASLRFGVDGSPFNGAIVNGARTESGYSPELPPKEWWENYSFGSRDVTVEEIRVVVDYYFWHPIFPELRASKIGFEITGSYSTTVTILAPEPSSFFLMTLGWFALVVRRERGFRSRCVDG
jgi:hypothetical protein